MNEFVLQASSTVHLNTHNRDFTVLLRHLRVLGPPTHLMSLSHLPRSAKPNPVDTVFVCGPGRYPVPNCLRPINLVTSLPTNQVPSAGKSCHCYNTRRRRHPQPKDFCSSAATTLCRVSRFEGLTFPETHG